MDPGQDFEIPNYFGRTTNKAFTETKTTPVILVCIHNKNSTLITHDLLYNVFSAYGKILRILIFEKVKVWKAFVEFSSVDEAVEAKRNLNDFLLFSDGTRMNIYYSNLETIKFQNNNAGGVDYTQPEQKDLTEFREEFSVHENRPPMNVQPENIPPYRMQHPVHNNPYDQIPERSASSNSQSQPNSGQLRWPVAEPDDVDENYAEFLNPQMDDRDNDNGNNEPDSNQDVDEPEGGHFDHKFLDDAFPASWSNNQELGYGKRANQGLQFGSQPFGDQSQPTRQTSSLKSALNSTPFWPQGLSNNSNSTAPPGLSFFPGSNQNSMPFQAEPSRLMRMPNSFTHIPLKHHSPHNTPPISRNSTFTELPNLANMPNPNTMNSGPVGLGMLPRHSTFTDLPKPSGFPKPALPQFGSFTNLPKTSGPSAFSTMGTGGNPQGMNQGGQQMPPQLNKPMLNPRFMSTPELPMASEIAKFKLDNMSSQNVRDLIERDLVLRMMMNKMQNPDGNDMMQQNPTLINDMDDITKFIPGLQGIGNINYEDLAQMDKGTLDQIYQNLSSYLGKSVENKECAVLYVKGLEHKDIKVRMLYNIFSNFGNIRKIIFIRRQAAALIEYDTVDYATKAKDYLNNIVFMGKPLRIYYSFHAIINLKNKKNGKDATEEIFIGTPKTYRFGKNKNISMNPPSSTLHVSNLVKEMCTEDVMRNYFSPYGRIEAIQIKCMENNRNMCLIRMASMEESLNAMAYLHDTDLGGRPIQISFTKSKI